MNIQDITYENAQYLIKQAGDYPILLGYKTSEQPEFKMDHSEPHAEDPRFNLISVAPYTRKLAMTLENEDVLVGIFYVLENKNRPYPLCAQYSVYYVDKNNPEKECKSGILPSGFAYPPISERNKGIDRKDYVKLINFINDGLKLNEFKSSFPLKDISTYHEYWPRPEFDAPHPGPIGREFRAEDGVLRRLDAIFENDVVRVEITSHIEIYTELNPLGYHYSIDVQEWQML